ncbi:MAG: LysM peptidoglycan-binding domain-containing protein [Gammaproteobacteria bacterium]|nr:LysM peptidoglycan-binding domain-containing protein [Gammaproteobacteria bacterium]
MTSSPAKAEYRVVYPHSEVPMAKVAKPSVDSSGDIWRVFQKEFTLDHQAERPEVKEQIAWFMAHRKYLRAAATNARPYMYYIITQIRKRNLPLEFALLPIIESAYDPFAYSTSGAAGLWQMMPATATDFGLKQTWWYDGRRDVFASTNAALDYLVYLQNFFHGNWMFTVAAYHAGQGTILNAVKKNTAKGEATDFWSLPLGKQTQLYIPKLLALAEMIGHPEKYPLGMPEIPNKPYLTQVDVGSQIDLAKAASLSGLSLNALMNLNPGFNRWATSPDGPFLLVVPIQNETQLREGLALMPQRNRVTWERYDVQSGDTLGKIATKYHTSMAVLQQVNKLDDTLIHVGDVIFIPNSAHVLPKSVSDASPIASMKSATKNVASTSVLSKSSSVGVKEVARPLSLPPETVYRVRKGDTLSSIAHSLNVSWKNLRAFNNLSSDTLKIGQKLNIPPKVTSTENAARKTLQKIHYVIQAKDSLGKIAQQFAVSVEEIERWNPSITEKSVLHPGKTMVIYQVTAE